MRRLGNDEIFLVAGGIIGGGTPSIVGQPSHQLNSGGGNSSGGSSGSGWSNCCSRNKLTALVCFVAGEEAYSAVRNAVSNAWNYVTSGPNNPPNPISTDREGSSGSPIFVPGPGGGGWLDRGH